jgi:beta-lactamase superfamily II metal-dependent hydrolase
MELSVFGPGVGECILIQLPTKKWIIIDSFIDFSSQKPIAIEYLEKNKVDLKKDVELIVITHWHSDHISGMAEIISSCTSATIVIPSAFRDVEFQEFINVISNDFMAGQQNVVKEAKKAFKAMRESGSIRKIILADEGKCLYKNEENGIDVVAISPSSDSVLASLAEISGQYNEYKASVPRKHVVKGSQNHNAIAILVIVNNISILLGSDLEEPQHNPQKRYGWSAVLSSQQISKRKSIIFKVPHHGSITGHHPDVWTDLLREAPTSIITRFNSSKLPNQTDIDRIKKLSSDVYVTTSPKIPSVNQRPTNTSRAIKKMCNKIDTIKGLTGHLKVDIDPEIGSIKTYDNGNVEHHQ